MHPAGCGCSIRPQRQAWAPLAGALALVLITTGLVGAVGAGWVDAGPERAATAPERVSEVRFRDRADGSVVVERVDGPPAVLAPGEGGFLRMVLRSFANDRRSRGLGPDAPFRLARGSDDRLTLTDTATGRVVSLEGFGTDNRLAFAKLLEDGA